MVFVDFEKAFDTIDREMLLLNLVTSFPFFLFEMAWSIYKIIQMWTAVVDESEEWSPEFFRVLLSNCLNWKIYCDDFSSTTAVHMNYFIYTSRHFTPHGIHELNKLTSLPMCGFIAQLVEHRTGIAEVMGSNPVEALIFSGFYFPIA